MYETPSYKEDMISQVPAIKLLVNLGYTYLTPDETRQERNDKASSVLLEGILRRQLMKINSISYRGKEYDFSEGNIEAAIQALKDLPHQDGYIETCKYAYDLITLGKSFEQSIDGDKKSYTLKFIDWRKPGNNVFHVVEEFNVARAGSNETYRPDIVLFVNGIPLSIIECKRPDMKEPLKQAISQHIRSQQENGIRSLYVYSQLLLSIATNFAMYGTNGAGEKFWSAWEEKLLDNSGKEEYQKRLKKIKNRTLSEEVIQKICSGKTKIERAHFAETGAEESKPTVQDEYLYNLCRPERLLDLIYNFIVFEPGAKKIARYPQYFGIKKTIAKIRSIEGGTRKGGVIWHTQGSGKSLTMVLLAQAIALDPTIRNPKIVLVTDRIDLDVQITETFKKCGKEIRNATTGRHLLSLLQGTGDYVVTTVINKFESAMKQSKAVFESADIFVLVDEGHRTQYGNFNIKMRKSLPNACYIAMTGTPLLRREKSTALKFGGIIDTYTVDKAVADGAVVPLLYEGRHALQDVNINPIDAYFDKISEPLSDYQKADLKKKLSRAEQLNIADQKVYAIAWDLSGYFDKQWKNSGLKGQLVCPTKQIAVKYKNYLDEIALVSSELVISPPDEREGEEDTYGSTPEEVKAFWKRMMDQYGTAKNYENHIISRFKSSDDPEILIVVDKLLTGFDAPRNTVLFLTRNLKEHTLLQAIARVNRVFPGKEFGYIIDYYGVLQELADAIEKYTVTDDYDQGDLEGILAGIEREIKKLPQHYSELWDLFRSIENKKDAEAFESLLRDDALRHKFYEKLSAYGRTLKIALSSLQFHKETPEKEIEKYKADSKFFYELRRSVNQRYSDVVDFSLYERQLQKLIDKHVTTSEVKPLTELVDIFDKEKFREEVDKTIGPAARADKIAHRTAKYINENMQDDPAFFRKFSKILQDAISDYLEKRITELEYLHTAKSVMESVLSRQDEGIPQELKEKATARAYFGLVYEAFEGKVEDEGTRKSLAKEAALGMDNIINELVLDEGKPVIDWQEKSDITGKVLISFGDLLIDDIRDKHNISLTMEEIDKIAEECFDIVKRKYRN